MHNWISNRTSRAAQLNSIGMIKWNLHETFGQERQGKSGRLFGLGWQRLVANQLDKSSGNGWKNNLNLARNPNSHPAIHHFYSFILLLLFIIFNYSIYFFFYYSFFLLISGSTFWRFDVLAFWRFVGFWLVCGRIKFPPMKWLFSRKITTNKDWPRRRLGLALAIQLFKLRNSDSELRMLA